jgi:hypothetical protein
MGKPIYVEIAIRAPLYEIWRLSQSPDLHQRWDLRFTRIPYLPRPDPAQPQRFLYVADVHEWFDDRTRRFGIEVTVTNWAWGRLFGYRGWFTAEWPACSREAIPRHVRPVREERRE